MQTSFCPSRRPPPVALIRVAGVSPVAAFVRRIGVPVQRLLARANLPIFLFDHPESLITLSQAFGFMDEAARAGGVENLGVLAGRRTEIDGLGVFGRLLRRSRTLLEAIETVIRTMPAFSSATRCALAYEGDRARLSVAFTEGSGAGHPQAGQYGVMLALNVVGLAADPRQRRDAIGETRSGVLGHIDVVPDSSATFRRGETSVSFPRSLLDLPLSQVTAVRRIENEDVEAWIATGPANDFPRSLLQAMATLSSPDYPRIGQTARAIGMSVRALQRRLAEVDVSYGRLVTRARFAMAVHLLEETDANVLDIALDLGYSDHAHFTRAFRRWTGVTPRDFRRVSHGTSGTPRTGNEQAVRAETTRPASGPVAKAAGSNRPPQATTARYGKTPVHRWHTRG